MENARVWYVGPVGLAGRVVILEENGHWFNVVKHYGDEAQHINFVDVGDTEHPLNRELVKNLYSFRKGQGEPSVRMYQGLFKGGSLVSLSHEELKFVAQLLTWICKEEIAEAATKEIPKDAKAA